MDGACGKYKKEEKKYTGFWWQNVKERDYLEDLVVDGRLIVKLIFKK